MVDDKAIGFVVIDDLKKWVIVCFLHFREFKNFLWVLKNMILKLKIKIR